MGEGRREGEGRGRGGRRGGEEEGGGEGRGGERERMGKGEGPEETGIFLVFSLTFGLVV